MDTVEAYLDEALDLSNMELSMLTEGDVEQAEALAQDRARLVEMAWRGRARVSKDQFLNRLEQLKTVHDNAHAEAKRLHKILKDDLLRIRKQGQLLSGYRSSVADPLAQEARFISKQG